MPLDHLPLHRFSSQRPPVVLLGGLNLVRTLGLAGIPAIVASADPWEPALASRFCSARVAIPRLEHGEAAADALLDLGRRLTRFLGRRVPLMYGSDDALEVIHAHRERLERHFLFLLCDANVASALVAKDRFQRFALTHGLPVPRELAWEGDGPGTLRGSAGPVLVKPRHKADWHHTTLCQRLFGGDGKARIFEDGAAVLADPDVADFRSQLQFQEYIPGGDEELWSYHAFADARSAVVASFVGRKIRTYPTLTGESAYIELAHDEDLERLGQEITRQCGLRGAFKMDFKRHTGTGRWYLLEVNARYNLWHYLGARNGLNLMQAAYEYLVHGVARAPREYSTRHRWLSLELDIKAYRELAAQGRLGAIGWLRSIARPGIVHNIFWWRDPLPWLHLWRGRLTTRLDRVPARLLLALRQWRSTAS